MSDKPEPIIKRPLTAGLEERVEETGRQIEILNTGEGKEADEIASDFSFDSPPDHGARLERLIAALKKWHQLNGLGILGIREGQESCTPFVQQAIAETEDSLREWGLLQ